MKRGEAALTAKDIVRLSKEYTFFSWAVQSQANPIPVTKAEGVHFWDAEGKRYLDFSSQLMNTNVGHQHPKIVKTIQDQAAQLCFVHPGNATEPRGLLGKKLAAGAPRERSDEERHKQSNPQALPGSHSVQRDHATRPLPLVDCSLTLPTQALPSC